MKRIKITLEDFNSKTGKTTTITGGFVEVINPYGPATKAQLKEFDELLIQLDNRSGYGLKYNQNL